MASIRGKLTRELVYRLVTAGNNVTDIARLAGVSRPTVYAWMRGQGAHAKSLVKLAELTDAHLPSEFDALLEEKK